MDFKHIFKCVCRIQNASVPRTGSAEQIFCQFHELLPLLRPCLSHTQSPRHTACLLSRCATNHKCTSSVDGEETFGWKINSGPAGPRGSQNRTAAMARCLKRFLSKRNGAVAGWLIDRSVRFQPRLMGHNGHLSKAGCLVLMWIMVCKATWAT